MIQLEKVKTFSNNAQIFIFFAMFAAIFYSSRYLLKFASKRYSAFEKTTKNQIAGRVISTVHAAIVSFFSLLILFFDPKIHQNKLLYNTIEISVTLNIVIGYMLFDFFLMILYKEMLDYQFVLHHAVSVSAFYACTQAGVFPYIAIYRLTSEASTPCVNARWFLLTFNMKHTKYYTYTALSILIFFGIFRIIPIIPIWQSFLLVTQDPNWNNINFGYKLLCVFSSMPLDVLNVYWFYRIIVLGLKHMNSSPKSNTADSNKKENVD